MSANAPCGGGAAMLDALDAADAAHRDDPELRERWTAHTAAGCAACDGFWLNVVSVRLAAGRGHAAAWRRA